MSGEDRCRSAPPRVRGTWNAPTTTDPPTREDPRDGRRHHRRQGRELQRLHRDPALLTVVNVWDVITARVVADTPGTTALATASHSIAASYGYQDGENIPRDLMIEAVGRIAAAVDLPVTADLEAGYGDAGETVRPRHRRRHRRRQPRGPDEAAGRGRPRQVEAAVAAG